MGKKIFITSPRAVDHFKLIINLKNEQISKLHTFIKDKKGFDFGIKDCWELSEVLNLSAGDTVNLVHITEYLFDQVQRFEFTNDELAAEFKNIIQEKEISTPEDIDSKISLIVNILRDSSIQNYVKIIDLKRGIIKYADEFKSFCDYRPLFSKDRKEIRGLVPVIIARVITRDDSGNKEDIVFQLNEESFKKLVEFVSDVQNKIQTMKKYNGEKIKIIDNGIDK